MRNSNCCNEKGAWLLAADGAKSCSDCWIFLVIVFILKIIVPDYYKLFYIKYIVWI